MLLDLLKQGELNKKSILLKHYKEVGLNETQVAIVLLIMDLSEDQKKIITSTELKEYMTISSEKIDNEIDKMITKGLVKISAKSIDFTNLFITIADIIEDKYSDFKDDSFIKTMNKKLSKKLSVDDIEYLNSRGLSTMSKEKIASLAEDETISTFSDLKIKLEKELNKKVRPITKYNWLED